MAAKDAPARVQRRGLGPDHELTGRARELAAHIESVLRSRQGLAGGIRVTRDVATAPWLRCHRSTRTLGWLSRPELLALPAGRWARMYAGCGGWCGSRWVPRHLPRRAAAVSVAGISAGSGRWRLTRRRRACTWRWSARGVGKSVLLTRGILVRSPRVRRGRDRPKGRPHRHGPRPRAGQSMPTGWWCLTPAIIRAPLRRCTTGGDPDLRTDVLIGAFKSIFSPLGHPLRDLRAAWRSALCDMPGATLADAGRLFARNLLARGDRPLARPLPDQAWRAYLAPSRAPG